MAEETIWKLDIQPGNSQATLDAFKNSLNAVKQQISQVTAAGQNFDKLNSFQTKAAEAAKRLEVAQASAAVALKKAEDAANGGKLSAEQVALAQSKAGLAAQKVETAQNALSVAMSKTQAEADRLASAMQEDASKTNIFARAAESVKSHLGSVGENVKGAVSNFLEFGSKLGQTVIGFRGLADGAISLATSLFSPNAQLEQMRVSFKAFIPDAKDLTQTLADLKKFSAVTPFEGPEVNKAALALLNMKVQAKDLTTWIGNMGAAVSKVGGDGAVLDDVAQIIQQMGVKGKVTTEEMMQLSERNIPAFQILADAMHVPVSSLQDMISKGEVGRDKIELLVQSMGKFGGSAMVEQGQTFNGLLSTFKDNVQQALASFTGPAFNMAKGALTDLGNLVSSPEFQQFATDMGEKVGNALQTVGNFLSQEVVPWFNELSQIIQQPTFKAFEGSLSDLGNALRGVWDALSPLVPKFDFFGDVVDKNSKNALAEHSSLNDVLQIIKEITPVINSLANDIKSLTAFFKDNSIQSQIVKDSLIGIGVAIAAIQIGSFLATIPALVAGFGLWAGAAWTAAAGTIAATWPILAIGAVIAIVVAGIILAVQHWGEISKWLQDRWKDVSSFFGGIWKDIQGFFGGVGQWFSDRWTEAANNTKSAMGNIGQWFGDRKNEIQNKFADIGGWFHDRGKDAYSGITDLFGGIGKWFGDRWKETMDSTKPFRDYMGAVFETIWNIHVAIFGKVGQWFHDRYQEAYNKVVEVFGPIGKWFQDRWQQIASIFQVVGGWFHDRFTEGYNSTTSSFAAIGKWFGDRWVDVQNIFKAVGGWFHDRWSEAWSGIVSFFGPIGKWFQDRWVDTQNVFKAVGKWFSDRFSEAWNGIVSFFAPIGRWFSDRWNDVMNGVNTFKKAISDKFNDIKTDVTNIFHNMINGIIDKLNDGIGAVEGFINFFGQGLDQIAKSLGTKGTIPKVTLGRIPHYASGTDSHPGGPAIVGEKGPELVFLPKGAQVAPNHITEMLLKMTGGKIPGYADGIGDLGSQILGWIGGGAKSVLDNVLNALHISVPNLLGMGNIASALFDKVKGWAVGWVDKLLPKFDFGSAGTGPIPGNLQQWIAAAMALTSAPGNWAGPLATIAMHESGGNPRAINDWDSNAQAGDPSRGLFQTIGATFRAYALQGHGDIYNPVDNAIAAIRYIMSRYGTVFNVPGIKSMASGGAYVGYANGGWITEPIAGIGLRSGTRYGFGENGPEMVLPRPGFVSSSSGVQGSNNDQIVALLSRILDTLERQGKSNRSISMNANVQPSSMNAQRINQLIQSLSGQAYEAIQRGAW